MLRTDLLAFFQQLGDSVVQIVVAVKPQSDGCTAEYGDDGQGDFEGGDGLGRTRFSVAASRQEVYQEQQEG